MARLRTMLPVLAVAALVAGFHLFAAMTGKPFYLTQAIMAGYYTIVALGLCLLMGYAGQISLGHGAFFALGGYVSAILTTRPLQGLSVAWSQPLSAAGVLITQSDLYGGSRLTFSPAAAFGVALLLTLLVAVAVGVPALRLRGHYLSMATLGFGLIVYRLVLGSPITGAADGITGVPPWDIGPLLSICGKKAHRVANYYVAWGLVVLTLLMLHNVVASRFGRALRAIHDHETAAGAMGVDTSRAKLQVFVLSALLAAAAGCLMTHYNGGIGPSEAGAMKSIRYVSLVAVGGMANLPGVLIASACLTFLSLRGCFGTYDHAVFGVILIAVVALAPEGPQRLVTRAWSAARRACRGGPHGAA